ncbi:MAG: sugar ABC transporter substrate-binding protein [Eubacteriales bacterium]
MKKNTKKLLSLLLALSLTCGLMLTGCSGGDTGDQGGDTGDQGGNNVEAKDPYTDELKFGFITNMIGHSVPVAWSTGIERELQYFPNIQYQAFDGENKAETQIKLMEELINQEYDVIFLQAYDSAALAASVEDAEAAGIPVINLNLDADTAHAGLVAMVDYEAGRVVAQEMEKALNGEGKVVILQSPPGASLGVQREKGFRDYIEANCPGIEIVAAQNAEWLKEKAMDIMNSFMQANPQIDGVFAVNDSMAEGAALAAKAAGRLDEMVIWGADGEKDALTMIENGELTGTVYTNCYEQGATAARLALYCVSAGITTAPNGSTPIVKLAPIPVTKENVGNIAEEDRW